MTVGDDAAMRPTESTNPNRIQNTFHQLHHMGDTHNG